MAATSCSDSSPLEVNKGERVVVRATGRQIPIEALQAELRIYLTDEVAEA